MRLTLILAPDPIVRIFISNLLCSFKGFSINSVVAQIQIQIHLVVLDPQEHARTRKRAKSTCSTQSFGTDIPIIRHHSAAACCDCFRFSSWGKQMSQGLVALISFFILICHELLSDGLSCLLSFGNYAALQILLASF